MHLLQSRFFAPLAGLICFLAVPVQSALLFEYTFNGNLTDNSTGSITTPLGTFNDASIGGVGPSEQTEDTALVLGGSNNANNIAKTDSDINIGGLGDFTITGWYNLSSITNMGTARILSIRDSNSSSDGIDLFLSGGGYGSSNPMGGLDFRINGGDITGNSGGAGFTISTGEWQFFALTRSGSTIQFWTGDQTTEVSPVTTNVTGTANTAVTNPNAPLRLGNSGDEDRGLHGMLDNIRIYDNALDMNSLEDLRALAVIPEPSTYALLFGLSALAFVCYRRATSRRPRK